VKKVSLSKGFSQKVSAHCHMLMSGGNLQTLEKQRISKVVGCLAVIATGFKEKLSLETLFT
jgi:hypothetical protein